MAPRMVRVTHHKDADGWWCESPDVPGWSGAADTYAELVKLAEDGIAFALGRRIDVVHRSADSPLAASLSIYLDTSALDELDTIWAALDVLEVTDALVKAATRTARDHTLCAYDAIHLAGALAFAEGEEIAFACWDDELSDAASKHGFALIPKRS